MDSLTFFDNDVKPEIKALYFCLILGIGSSIVLILYTLRESKKLKDFFIVGLIYLCIPLAVLYNLWDKTKDGVNPFSENEKTLYFLVCIAVLVSGSIISSALGDIKPYFNIISLVAIFLGAETSTIYLVNETKVRELRYDINIAANLFMGSLIFIVIGYERAVKKQIIGKVLVFLMGFIALTYSLVFTIFMVLCHTNVTIHKRLKLFKYYYLFVTNGLLPGCALLLLREMGDLEKEPEPDKANIEGNHPDDSRAILY